MRSSATSLTGAGLSGKASTAADAVSQARTTFANRLTNHSKWTLASTQLFKAADGAAACTPKSGRS